LERAFWTLVRHRSVQFSGINSVKVPAASRLVGTQVVHWLRIHLIPPAAAKTTRLHCSGGIINIISVEDEVNSRRRSASAWHLWFVSAALASAFAHGQLKLEAQRPVLKLSPESAVTVTGGQIRGVPSREHPEIIAFKGVPFAAPPVGQLRWR